MQRLALSLVASGFVTEAPQCGCEDQVRLGYARFHPDNLSSLLGSGTRVTCEQLTGVG